MFINITYFEMYLASPLENKETCVEGCATIKSCDNFVFNDQAYNGWHKYRLMIYVEDTSKRHKFEIPRRSKIYK